MLRFLVPAAEAVWFLVFCTAGMSALSRESLNANPGEETEMECLEIEEVPLSGVRITVVYDNTSLLEGLRSDWGFACVIEGLEKKLLFDTGADGELLIDNITRLAGDPREIEAVFLSHRHWDHVDGLERLLAAAPDVEVFLTESFPDDVRRTVTERGAAIREVVGPVEVCPGTYSTGEMSGDPEEQSLIIATDRSVLVVTGCSHPGISSIIRRAGEITGREILLVTGGFHLRRHSNEEVRAIIKDFEEMGVRLVGPCHCTGEDQIGMFSRSYGDNCLGMGVGRVITGNDIEP